VNAIIPFSVMALIWLALMVAAAIAGASPAPSPQIRETGLSHRYSASGGSWCVRLTVRALACAREGAAAR
jgi:hypothetical protein